MAPELIAGSVVLGEAYLVDLYALGVLAFELATGEVPFDADESTRVLWMHLVEPTPRLEERRSDLPAGLTTLVAEMLAKDPAARPGSAEEIAWRLRQLKARATSAPRSSAPAARLESA
jgi:serine/threonine-protein kinase